jgi:hypothetical protein
LVQRHARRSLIHRFPNGGTPVRTIPFLTQQTRFTFANFGETEPLALDEYQARGGLQGLEMALCTTPDAIIEELRVSQFVYEFPFPRHGPEPVALLQRR